METTPAISTPTIAYVAEGKLYLKREGSMLWGRFIDAEKALRKANQGAQGPLVPADWQLIRRAENGQEQVLAKNVLAYDLCSDGSVIYTNGTAIFHRPITGDSWQLCAAKMIERVTFAG